MTFNTEVIGCYWQEETGEWKVKLRKQVPGQEPEEFEEYCNVLLYGAGVLNNFKVGPSCEISHPQKYSWPKSSFCSDRL